VYFLLFTLTDPVPFIVRRSLQVLRRIANAVQSMVETAAFDTANGCLVAVTHSSYLRLLLGAVDGFTTFSAATPLANCCINVVDFARPTTTTSRWEQSLSTLSTPSRRTQSAGSNNDGDDSEIQFPKGRVIRVNEKRHLASIPSRASLLVA
jgi:hypothetical protein